MFCSSANQWLKSTWNASAAFSSLHLSGWTRTSGGPQSMTGLQSGSHLSYLSSGHWGFIGDSLGFIIKLVDPWHQFRSSPCIPCRVSKCHTESLLYCLVISDSVASGATWWCSSNLSWRSKMCCPNPESALQHQHQDDLLSIQYEPTCFSVHPSLPHPPSSRHAWRIW